MAPERPGAGSRRLARASSGNAGMPSTRSGTRCQSPAPTRSRSPHLLSLRFKPEAGVEWSPSCRLSSPRRSAPVRWSACATALPPRRVGERAAGCTARPRGVSRAATVQARSGRGRARRVWWSCFRYSLQRQRTVTSARVPSDFRSDTATCVTRMLAVTNAAALDRWCRLENAERLRKRPYLDR